MTGLDDFFTNKVFVSPTSGVVHRPRDCARVLWDGVRDPDVKQRISDFALNFQPPRGFRDAELWKHLPAELKAPLIESAQRTHTSKYKSPVARFFLDPRADDFDFDQGVNSFSIMNALVLTIPYSFLQAMDGTFWGKLKDTWSACDASTYISQKWNGQPGEEYSYQYNNFHSNVATAIYGSISALLLAAMYYVFRERNTEVLSSRRRIKQRFLLLFMYLSSIVSVLGALNMAGNLRYLSEDYRSMCNDRPLYRDALISGLFCIGFSVLFGVAMLW